MTLKWQAAEIFPTPVIKLHIDQSSRVKQFFYDNIHTDATGEDIDQQGKLMHFHSRRNVFIIYEQLNWLQEEIESQASFVYQNLLNFNDSTDLKVTNAWFNLCDVGGVQPPHSHVNCLLCGTLYLTTDENTKITFHHPLKNPSNHAELYDAPSGEKNRYGLRFHQHEAHFSVERGDCLFWPSYLKHGYNVNQTPNRLSLSFNIMPSQLNVDYQV